MRTNANVAMPLALVLIGGILQGSFALPMKRMSAWRWENTWFVYSVIGMLALPCALAWATVPHPWAVIGSVPVRTLITIAIFGFGWGVGSTLFGLGIARAGMALTFAIVLGITASLGSLLPLVVLAPGQILTPRGYTLLAGLVIVVFGIVTSSFAGHRREREQSGGSVRQGGASFWVGILICILSGIFSAMLNFSFAFGDVLRQKAAAAGAAPAMASNLIWAIALGAGFVANASYCLFLFARNRSWTVFVRGQGGRVLHWYWLGALAMGASWYFGIASYGVGAAGLGSLGAVVGWPVFMAMNIVTASLWGGLVAREWRGASLRTYSYSWMGIVILIVAIGVISHAS